MITLKANDFIYKVSGSSVEKFLIYDIYDELDGPALMLKDRNGHTLSGIPLWLIDNFTCGEYFTNPDSILDRLIAAQERLIESYREKAEMLDCQIIEAEMRLRKLQLSKEI